MNEQQIILLSILFVLLLLLVWGRYRYDIVALGALFVAALFGLIPQGELFSGLGFRLVRDSGIARLNSKA